MTVTEFDNKLTLLKQGADKTESIRDRLIFLLKAVEFVEELADDILYLPKSKLTEWEHGLVSRTKHEAYLRRSPLLNVIQQRVISEGRKEKSHD